MGQTLELILKIRCHKLPGVQVGEHQAVRLGIQKRHEVIEDVAADAKEALFIAPIRVELKATGTADFYGPFVHGTPKERFLNLCWGERNGEQWEGFGRAKLQLLPMPHALLVHALDNHSPLEVSIDMTDDKGNPLFATIKEKQLFWQS